MARSCCDPAKGVSSGTLTGPSSGIATMSGLALSNSGVVKVGNGSVAPNSGATYQQTAGSTRLAGPDIVSLGDSFISGEGGRWAGNTDEESAKVDALGPVIARPGLDSAAPPEPNMKLE